MRNKKFIFSMGVAALLFAACSNDDNLVNGTGGGAAEPTIVEGEPTYASFTVKSGEVKNSRAATAPETGDDQITGDVTLLIFNYQTKVLEDKFVMTPTSGTANGTFLMTSGKKRIYAFANLTAESGKTKIEALQPKVSTVDEMLALVADGTGTSLGQTTTNVPMSNIDDGLAKDVANGVEQGDAAASNHIDLTMLRMLSRAKLVLKSGVDDKFKASGFTANNIAKATYLVQHAVGGVVKSPLYEKSWGSGITADDFMAKEAFYTDGTANVVNRLNQYYYLTENTSPSFLKGAATHFILKGVYIPARIIRSGAFDVATQNLKFEYGSTPVEADCDEYCYVTESPNAAVIPTGEFFLNRDVLNDAIHAYNANVATDKQIAASDVKYNEYTTGSYYRINLGEGDAGATVFGVKRNNSYTVTVNSVTGPGFNTPDGTNGAEGDPSTPIDQKTYLDVTVTVAPWTEVTQGSDIN